ncbi:septum formation initiator family protein [Winogradskyella echinorum]|uniref:Septum formation initiator family protein n=1 Tax=Winogradskyella echinorum TaxID=538189 RepID=A0ABR6Y2D7_9FLAO|nr:septum formation initiator family protein [Winogradskyella echinorum]MBC3846893.1 septum formation initiator family protein [Winogradskyella echinorum]MBC5751241.1 septum formation initiator family protein [Winogradskyella echinorum]
MALFNNKYLKPFKNIYLLVLIVFVVWMLFFDAHSWLFHHELNGDIKELEYQKKHYKSEMAKDDKAIKELSTDEGLERTARETYYMKKPDEDIFIIEYQDSTDKQKKDE